MNKRNDGDKTCISEFDSLQGVETDQLLVDWKIIQFHISTLCLIEASLGPYAWEQVGACKRPMKRDIQEVEHNDPPLQRVRSSAVELPKKVPRGVGLDNGFLRHPELENLPRSNDVFAKIERDPILSYGLPPPNSTAGKVLEHASAFFTTLLRKYQPMTFKFGITHCAFTRWYNKKFGYKYSCDRFDRMHVLFASSNPHGPAFLEACLIDKFGSNLTAAWM